MAWEDRDYNVDRSNEAPRIRIAVPMPTPMTMAVMGACLGVFLLANVFGLELLFRWGRLSFTGGLAFLQPWRWLSYAYLHSSGWHIFFNLLWLYFFLPPLERRWGWRKALGFYTLGSIAAGIAFGLMCIFYPFSGLIGASGGCLAALGACAYLFPGIQFFGVIPIRVGAALFGILYLLTIGGDKDASNAAHLGGLVFGYFAPYYGRKFFGDFSRNLAASRRRRELQVEQDELRTVDRILDKVAHQGMQTLTRAEKKALQRATERQRQQELQRSSKARRGY